MKILDGKCVAENISKSFVERIKKCNERPKIAVLSLNPDDASRIYIKRIEKNCKEYEIGLKLLEGNSEEEFIDNFYKVRDDEEITGVMFQQPLPQKLNNLIELLPANKDVEGIGTKNMGKLFLGKEDSIIPCTSRAVIELINYYNIDLTGKKVVLVGRSDIVGKPLIPQLLKKDATLTICHSKTKNIFEETKNADVVIIAIGKANFLKKDAIKDGAILIDVGINYKDGRIVGDIDFEDVKEKASMCTPVPGGIGKITNAILIDNIIKSKEIVNYGIGSFRNSK